MEKLSHTFAFEQANLKNMGFWDNGSSQYYRMYSWAMWIIFIYVFDFFQVMFLTNATDVEDISAGLSIVISEIILIHKLHVFRGYLPRIEKVVKVLDSDEFWPKSPEEWKVTNDSKFKMKVLFRFYHCAGYGAIILYMLVPIIQGTAVLFTPAWYPWDISQTKIFVATYIYQAIGTYILATAVMAYDSIVCCLLLHGDLQYKRLQIMLRKLGHEPPTGLATTEVAEIPTKGKRCIYYDEMIRCILFHKNVNEFISEVENIFKDGNFTHFVASSSVICMTLYDLITTTDDNVLVYISRMVYLTGLTFELFLFCYGGYEVTYSSSQLVYSAFSSDFQKFDKATAQLLKVFMLRTTRERTIKAGSVISLSLNLNTFLQLMKSSYTFLAVLQSLQP